MECTQKAKAPKDKMKNWSIGDNNWEVIDTHNENKTRYKGAYEDVMIACHNLNKKFYRDGVI